MNEQKWFDQLNAKAEANYRKRQARRAEIKQRRTAAIRQHNKLIALNMTLAGVLGVAVGVLVCFFF